MRESDKRKMKDLVQKKNKRRRNEEKNDKLY